MIIKNLQLKKLEACSIYLKEVRKLNLIFNRERLFRYWIIKQYIDKIPHIDSVEHVKEYFSQIPLLKCSSSEYYAVPATFEQEQCWDYHMQPKDCISPQVLFFSYQ